MLFFLFVIVVKENKVKIKKKINILKNKKYLEILFYINK